MAIKEVITLEGVEQVEAGLSRINKAGEDSLKSFRDLGSQAAGGGFDKLVEGAKKAGLELENTSQSTLKFSTVLRALKPLLNDIGLGIGQFGSVARLASQSLTAFGVLAGGAAVVSLGKLEENLARMRGELEDAFRSPGAGQQAFTALNRQAQQFGSSVTALLPGLLAFQQALSNVDRTAKGFVALKAEDLPFALAPPNVQAVTEAYGNFIKILRAGRLSQDEAEKSATAFFNALKEGGQATKAALQALPIETINQLKQALGAAGQSNAQFFAAAEAGAFSIDQLTRALANFGPQAQKAFDSKAIKTMGDEVGRILAELNAGFAELSGKPFSDFVIGQLEIIRKGIRTTIDEAKGLIGLLNRIDKATEIPGLGKTVRVLREPGAIPGPTFEETAAAFAAEIDIKKQTTTIQANNTTKKENAATTRDLAAATKDLAAAMNQSSQSIQQAIDAESISIDEGIKRLNALHDAAIEARTKPAAEAGPPKAKFIDISDAAKLGTDAAAAFGKGWINAVQSNVVQPTTEALTTGFQDAVKPDFLKSAILTIFGPDTAKQLFDPIKQEIPAAQQEIVSAFQQTGVDAGINFSQGVQQTPPDLSGWLQSVTDFGSAAVNQAQQIYDQIKSIFAQPIQIQGQFTGFGGQAEGAPFVSGGKVRGRGTSTSDSNLAWLSVNEWVINARAVQHYGSALFSALNAMTLPRDFINRFSMGGLVRAMNSGNRMAAGGQVTPTPFTLVLPDGMRLGGMTATDETVARLRRYAVKSQLSATGRKPSWVR